MDRVTSGDEADALWTKSDIPEVTCLSFRKKEMACAVANTAKTTERFFGRT
jgi:hypothetical protein